MIIFAAVLLGIAALVLLFALGERREKRREAREDKRHESDRAHARELMLLHCDAIRSESKARAEHEEARLYRRGSTG